MGLQPGLIEFDVREGYGETVVHIRSRYTVGAMIATIVALLTMSERVSAHERWFVADPNVYPIEWGRLLSWWVLAAMLIAAAAVIVALLLDRRYRAWQAMHRDDRRDVLAGINEDQLSRVYAYLPFLLAIHTAVPLLVNGFNLRLFAPNLAMRTNLLSGILALAEVLIALALVYGVFTRYAALGLVGLFVAGVVLGPFIGVPPSLLPEHVQLVGIAIFLYIIGRGPFSGDAILGQRVDPNPTLLHYAIPALRWGVGLSFAILAFTEKLLNPTLARAFLAQSINFNLGSPFGLPDNLFIYGAGVAELVFGCLLISGALPRAVIIVLWVPSNLTLPYLGWVELAGHLPIYAVLLTLLIIGSSDRPTVRRRAHILAEEAGRERVTSSE